jgi:uncharacterized protein YxjI
MSQGLQGYSTGEDAIPQEATASHRVITAPTRYRMIQRVAASAGDFVVDTSSGTHAYRIKVYGVDGRAVLSFIDLQGNEIYRVEASEHGHDLMSVHRGTDKVAVVKRVRGKAALHGYVVKLRGESDLLTEGKIRLPEYRVKRDGALVASVSHRWFSGNDYYGVAVSPGEDVALLLAVASCIDWMCQGR